MFDDVNYEFELADELGDLDFLESDFFTDGGDYGEDEGEDDDWDGLDSSDEFQTVGDLDSIEA